MKKFNILGFHGKIQVLGGSRKANLRGVGLQEAGGGGGLRGRGLIPQCTQWTESVKRNAQSFRNTTF